MHLGLHLLGAFHSEELEMIQISQFEMQESVGSTATPVYGEN